LFQDKELSKARFVPPGIERTISVALLIWALIGIYEIAQFSAGASRLWPLPEWLSYTFQPAVRFLIGAWLLQIPNFSRR
jgi:hypothetical protein